MCFYSLFSEGVQKVFGTLDLFVSLLETEIKYPILQGGILPFWTPSLRIYFLASGVAGLVVVVEVAGATGCSSQWNGAISAFGSFHDGLRKE